MTVNKFDIRPAVKADLATLVKLDQLIFGIYGGDEDPEIIAARLTVYPQGCAILEHKDATIAGYLTTEKWHKAREPVLNEDPAETHKSDGTVLNITTLAIVPAFQNQRLGERLLHHAEELARSEGCTDVILETARARKFYERHGYALVGERQQQGVLLYVMQRTL